jgi:hypothetical protein
MPFVMRYVMGAVLRLHLTRDSVAAGDDINAPHAKHMQIEGVATAIDVVNAVIQCGYLPNISGGRGHLGGFFP